MCLEVVWCGNSAMMLIPVDHTKCTYAMSCNTIADCMRTLNSNREDLKLNGYYDMVGNLVKLF